MAVKWIAGLALLVLPLAACGEPDSSQMAEASRISVEGNVVTSASAPALRIRVDDEFEYLGRHDIRIRDAASGERLVFADLQEGRAARLIIFQFEGFNEGIDDQYRYDLSNSPEVAGFRWRSNPYTFNLSSSIANNPEGESAATAAFLAANNVDFPEDWMMWRSLTVTTEDRRNELILFYVEDLASTGRSLEEIYDESGDSTDYWRGLMPALERRANASFALAPLENDDWQPIPPHFNGTD